MIYEPEAVRPSDGWVFRCFYALFDQGVFLRSRNELQCLVERAGIVLDLVEDRLMSPGIVKRPYVARLNLMVSAPNSVKPLEDQNEVNSVWKSIIFLAGMIACMATAQVLLKLAGVHAAVQFDLLHAFLGNPWLWCALLAYGGGLLCWMMTLRNMPLAVAYPWTALIYVLSPLASTVFFAEVLGAKYIMGMVGIIVGVVLTSGGVETK